MDRDKLEKEVVKKIRKIIEWAQDNQYSDAEVEYEASIQILSLLAPVIEKAAFLDDIIKRTDDKDCYENGWCPLSDTCDGKLWCRDIKKALEVKDGN